MARRATVIKQERKNNKNVVLTLDAGNTLFGQWLSQKSQGQVLVEAMNAMEYDAMTIGQLDISMGLDVIRQREKEAKFPFLSANLVSTGDEKLLFKPYVTLERQGARIGILGLSELQASQSPGVADKVKVLNPVETARRYVAELRGKVDVLVVLSHLGLEEDKALAGAVPGIDVIVGGNTRRLMEIVERVGNTLVVQQGFNGEWIGRLQATFDEKGVPSKYEEKMITLGPEFTDDPDVAAINKKWSTLYPSPTPPPTQAPPSVPGPTATRPPIVPPIPPTKAP